MPAVYWRLYFPNSPEGGTGYNGANGVCAVGVEMRASIGGGNEIGGGTASASSYQSSIIGGSFPPDDAFVAYSGSTRWQTSSGNAQYPHWLAYDFGSGNDVEIEEITMTGVAGTSGSTMPARFVLQYSDDNVNWTSKYFWQTPHPWVTDGSDNRVFNGDNAVDYTFMSQMRAMSLINFPAEELHAAQASALTLMRQTADLQVPQVRVVSLVRGRTANPRLYAWTFSLDGHDFYVLRLGDDVTLVYDLYSEQWVDWSSPGLPFWRPNFGINWIGGTGLAHDYGSNIVVGDDVYGLLWFLDPNQPFDQHPDYLNTVQDRYFERITMGQVPIRGREVVPCFAAWLTTDTGDPAYLGAGVTLYTSDDGGETFDDHGLVTVTPGEFNPELSWYSLGQIGAPGRLFKIVDDGAVARIDGMEMNDPDDDG